MSTHNIDFYEDLTKIIFEVSSNTHLISSTEDGSQNMRKQEKHFPFTLIPSSTQNEPRCEKTGLRGF